MSLSENVEALQKRHVACMELPYPYKNAAQPAWSFRIPTKTPRSLHGASVSLQKRRAACMELPYPYKNAVQPAWSFRTPTKSSCRPA